MGKGEILPQSSLTIAHPIDYQKYGPLVEINALGQKMLITNSHRVATELMTERGGIYSGRPFLQMAAGEVGWDRLVSFTNPGDDFRDMRRIFHRTLEAKKADKVSSILEAFEALY
jgi:hypothetical protein